MMKPSKILGGFKLAAKFFSFILLCMAVLITPALANTISGGDFYSLAINNNKEVVIWGGTATIPAGLTGVVAVSAGGSSHSLALKADGTVVAWGSNDYGQCNVPAGLTGVVEVSARYAHSLALKADGTVVAWGKNNKGECNVPAGLTGVVAISAGNEYSLALKADGTVVAWGWNWLGQCNVPTGLAGVVTVSAGGSHSLALKADGTVVAWGANHMGERIVPTGLNGVVAVSAGGSHSLALKADGTVVAWGSNNYSQCAVPAGLTGVVAISAGGAHSMALKADGTVVAWGHSNYGEYIVPGNLICGVPPTANAGPNQNTYVGSTTQLCGGGVDPDNSLPLSYTWSFLSKPEGSSATLSNSNIFNPTFVADKAGSYVLNLIVTDAQGFPSQPARVYQIDRVTISTVNSAPIANAGPPQTIHTGYPVTLNGSGSYDPDGDTITYAWTWVSRPDGSQAILNNANSVSPSFSVDKAGSFTVQLIVTDSNGAASSPSYVTINTNSAPVAEAGLDQSVRIVDTTVQLDGTQSYDDDGDPLTYRWAFVSVPDGSIATLTNPTSAMPSFVPDKYGDYQVQLVVNDPWVASSPDTVRISFENLKPIANAGTSQAAVVNEMVYLNGSASSDANGDSLTYQWSFASLPTGSTAIITALMSVTPTFVPDVPGDYVVQLIVNDGLLSSEPATVQIHVISQQTAEIIRIQNLITVIQSINVVAFKNATMQNALINKLSACIANIEAGNYADTLGQLQNDVLAKTDGCATTGTPDRNDWIKDCNTQAQIYPDLMEIITKLQEIM